MVERNFAIQSRRWLSFWLICLSYIHKCSANPKSIESSVIPKIYETRGGNYNSPLLEKNINYYGYNKDTLGDLEQRDPYLRQFNNQNAHNYPHPSFQNGHRPSRSPPPLKEILFSFFLNLKKLSPTIFYGITSSIFIFILWQIPAFSNILQRHFICSRSNILKDKRVHNILSSAISHASFRHLAMNMYVFYRFGSSVKSILSSYYSGCNLWQFCLGAAVFSNIVFLLSSQHGSCIGLSGVTFALVTLYTKVYPTSQLSFIFVFIPIQLPAQYLLYGLIAFSVFGVLTNQGGVAHATHLGGITYGYLFYELWKNKHFQKYIMKQKQKKFNPF